MSTPTILPLASYGITVKPGRVVEPIAPDFPVSVRLTMAALDPHSPVDNKNQPSTLKLIQFGPDGAEDDDDEDDEDFEENEMVDIAEDDDEEDDDEDDEDAELDAEEGDDEDDDQEDEGHENVICTLSPTTGYQQTLDLVITPFEPVAFTVVGSYPVHITGNYVEHPYDNESDEDEDEEDEDEDDEEEDDEESDDIELIEDDSEDADLLDELDSDLDQTPDEDELQDRIRELVDEEDEKKTREEIAKASSSAKGKKRDAEVRPEPETKSKKQKKAEEKEKEKEKKKVEFSQSLEKGPAATESKYPTKKLEGGIIVEDRKIGQGPQARKGQTVGMRYIGKLKNGKVFDKNVNGKPFYFKLGKGEVIKGWDIGVAGMAANGERRIVIPAAMAYGRQSLPGIPANSELTFDVKLVNIK